MGIEEVIELLEEIQEDYDVDGPFYNKISLAIRCLQGEFAD